MQNSKDLQLQYQGFLKTPFLWFGKGVFNLQQFESVTLKTSSFSDNFTQKLRLGKLVERFVSFEINQASNINILSENTQIQDGTRTVGELDCLLLRDNEPVHLEIIYKFYLYDASEGNSEIEHWIGPNRRDSLLQKIIKLKEKQLPLLYSNYCKKYLNNFNLTAHKITQQVYFKAQLFVPLKDVDKQFLEVNNNCIKGFYIDKNQLQQFSDCKFYMPNKHNWLVEPHTNISWLNFDDFKAKLNIYFEEKNAPLCWLKKQNGTLFKFFVVWW